ncbi:membrane magnesium transporter-domain-containing protein [Trametes polyzona]|nr:membrane magnesium transporter-domain-containing protein [Trametes polyzona]
MLGQILLLVATVALLHAAYSVYEHLSLLKAMGRPEGSLPNDIVLEAVASLFLAIVGATLRSPPLREVTWRSEMKRRAQEEDEDPRLSFATFAQRAGIAPKAPSPSSL